MKRILLAVVVALCLVVAGTGAVSAADAGTEKCMPADVGGADGDSNVGTQACSPPPCNWFCVVEPAGS